MTGLLLLLPKAGIALAALLALLLDSLSGGRTRRRVVLAVVVLLFAGAATAAVGIGRTGVFLEGTLVVDRFSIFADIVLLVLGGVVALAALDGVGSGHDAGDFYTLFFLSLAGASILASAGSLITVFLAIELAIIPTFALVAFRAADRRSFEAALKYFLLSVFASAIMLFGFSLVYGAVGSVALPLPGDAPSSGLLVAGIALTLVGFGFKIAAFPFHQWLPDAFEVSHPEVAAFLAVGPKLAAVVALVRVLEGLAAQSGAWTTAIAGVALLSMVWGNLGAFRQQRIPRLLAYSAIAHAGYALVGLAGGGSRGVEGAVVYFGAYSAAAVGAFLVVGVLVRVGIGDRLGDIVGLGRRRPLPAAAMTIFMISMVGIPLFAGFWGKFSVFLGAVEGGVVWLAVVGVINSAMSFGYYGNVIRLMYLEGGEDPAHTGATIPGPAVDASAGLQIGAHGAEGWGIRVALGIAVGFTVLLGVVPGILFGALGVSPGF
ncbi:MAG: NADH-quinone oxidoreductase subunit N [Thermoleophilia bacterium]